MPIIIDGREIAIPAEIPLARERFGVPAGECFGCFLGDAGPEMHDVPDACEYLGGFVYRLDPEDAR
jgi:hypothetical protein